MIVGRRPRVVVLGMMTKMPVAGVVWQTLHYVVGFERLGWEAYYVEAHGRTPNSFVHHDGETGSERAAAFIDGVLRPHGLADRWAFHALHADGRVYGMPATRLAEAYATAELIVNLHGGTRPREEHSRTGRLIYVETDPVEVQVELFHGDRAAIEFLEPHVAFFTYAENYGRPGCGLPVDGGFDFQPTRPPVVLDFWPLEHADHGAFTTIGNWRQPWRTVRFRGETYTWSKHLEFRKFLEVPARTGQSFELALSGSSVTANDLVRLRRAGWRVRDALEFSHDPDAYRRYVATSRGEFTVAKDQNVRLRTGWFSDRSATYLASGRPVVTQETGFSGTLPTGRGLFAFDTLDDVERAVEAVATDYRGHREAARAVARECFAHDVVLTGLADRIGLRPIRR